jgi:hypothetical protein
MLEPQLEFVNVKTDFMRKKLLIIREILIMNAILALELVELVMDLIKLTVSLVFPILLRYKSTLENYVSLMMDMFTVPLAKKF